MELFSQDRDNTAEFVVTFSNCMVWVDEAEKENPEAPYIRYWKAKIQLKAGDKKGAIATAQKGVEIAQKGNNAEYVKLNNQVIKEAGK